MTQQVKKAMKSLFRWAQEAGYTSGNAAAHIKLKVNAERDDIVTYSPEQFETLLAYVNPYYRTHLMTLFYSSMRWGELAALPWKHVVFREDGRVDIHIRQALSGGTIASPKTKKSRRIITLPSFIAEALKAHREVQRETQDPHPEDFVFTSLVGCTLNATRFRERIYYHALRRANEDLTEKDLPELPKVRLHGLRHSTISVLAMQPDVAGVVVQEHAGHANAATTAIYTHVDDLRRKIVSDVLEDAHRNALGAPATESEPDADTA